jgi:hypothetical protein
MVTTNMPAAPSPDLLRADAGLVSEAHPPAHSADRPLRPPTPAAVVAQGMAQRTPNAADQGRLNSAPFSSQKSNAHCDGGFDCCFGIGSQERR